MVIVVASAIPSAAAVATVAAVAAAVAVAAAGVAYARVEMGLGRGLRWALGWRIRSVLR